MPKYCPESVEILAVVPPKRKVGIAGMFNPQFSGDFLVLFPNCGGARFLAVFPRISLFTPLTPSPLFGALLY